MKLKEIITVLPGYPFRGKIPEIEGAGVRVVQMKDVSLDYGVEWNTLIETELSGKRQPDWLGSGDILFVARGSSNYAVLINESQESVVCAPHFYKLQVKVDALLPAFLVWQLNAAPLQSYFEKVAEGTLTKSIRRSVLENATIILPSLERQQEILNLDVAIHKEKQLYKKLIINADKFMNAMASEMITAKGKHKFDSKH